MHGHVSEEKKLELLQASWINLTASSAEGWCLTVMEAAACGTPSVAMAVGGLPESIENGRTGLLARRPHELAEHTRAARATTPSSASGWGMRRWSGLAPSPGSARRRNARRTRRCASAAAGRPRRRSVAGLAASDTGRAAGLAGALMVEQLRRPAVHDRLRPPAGRRRLRVARSPSCRVHDPDRPGLSAAGHRGARGERRRGARARTTRPRGFGAGSSGSLVAPWRWPWSGCCCASRSPPRSASTTCGPRRRCCPAGCCGWASACSGAPCRGCAATAWSASRSSARPAHGWGWASCSTPSGSASPGPFSARACRSS